MTSFRTTGAHGGEAARPTLRVSATEADGRITEQIRLGRHIADSANDTDSSSISAAYAEMYSWDKLNRALLPTLFDGPILDEYPGTIRTSIPAGTTTGKYREFQEEVYELLRQLSSIRSKILLWGGLQVPKYFHVRLTEQGQRSDEIQLDIDQETLERQFLRPYRDGKPITINGRSIPSDLIERLRINSSDQPSSQLIRLLEDEDKSLLVGKDAYSSTALSNRPSYAWRAAARAEDVTNQYITGPAGTQPIEGSTAIAHGAAAPTVGPGDKRSVFVVTGRDSVATSAVVDVLRAMGLRIVEWEHAVAKTGLPAPYIGDVVVAGLQMADVAVIILSADDIVRLRQDLARDSDGDNERLFQGQARPNVFYEAGIADALGRERTLLVEVGDVKSFSDVSGRHVLRYDGSAPKKNALAERLKVAGLEVDTGGSDWLTKGDVTASVLAARTAIDAARS